MAGYPKTAEEARQRVLALMNKIIEVDEPFARCFVEEKFYVPDSIMDAEGADEVQIVVVKNQEGKWVTSTLGMINGILKAIGCEKIIAQLDTDDDGKVISIVQYLPWQQKPKPRTLVELEDQDFVNTVDKILERPKNK